MVVLKRSPIESPLIRSYRELLGVTPSATSEDLKKAYRKLVVLYHPDKNPDPQSQSQFLKITEAYETLSQERSVEVLNKKYLEKRLYDYPIEGLNVSFGSFFGYRKFSLKRSPRQYRIGQEKMGERDLEYGTFDLSYSDTQQSILDSPVFDSLELVYAGRFSLGDEDRVLGGFKGEDLGRLPWVLLNNKGIIHFLEGQFSESLKCYEELNDRIPNNIIFTYRLGLCHALLAFQKKTTSLLGRVRPDPFHLKTAVKLLRLAIAIGENRTVGKQKCLTVRKTLGDIFDKIGETKLAKKIWKDIHFIDPDSAEANLRLKLKPKIKPRLK